jgi:4-hydroxybenzoate polyprenyltransferase
MELDQLKEMWGTVEPKHTQTSEQELQLLLQKKSKSPIAKMKRNLTVEMWVVVVLYAWIIIDYVLQFKGLILTIPLLLFIVGLLYIVYYVRKRNLLKQMECVTCEVKSNLQQQVRILEKYIRFYMISGTVLFPFTVIFVSAVMFFSSPEIQQLRAKEPLSFGYFFLAVTIISAVLTVPIYFLNKWYVRKLYGQHAEKLKQIVNEMNEEE